MSTLALGMPKAKTSLKRLALIGGAAVATLNILTLALVGVGLSLLQAVATNVWGIAPDNRGLLGVAILVAVGLSGLGGAAWGQLLARLTGYTNRRRIAWATAIAYGLALPVVITSLGQFESYLTKGGAIRPEIIANIHWLFLGSWSLGMVVLLGVPALALGLSQGNAQAALVHALKTGVAAGLAFVVVDAIMYNSGWRVGDPDFPERPTMSVVVLLGFSCATLVSGILNGLWLRDRATG